MHGARSEMEFQSNHHLGGLVGSLCILDYLISRKNADADAVPEKRSEIFLLCVIDCTVYCAILSVRKGWFKMK